MPFVEAARAIGISEIWIAVRHVLPVHQAALDVRPAGDELGEDAGAGGEVDGDVVHSLALAALA